MTPRQRRWKPPPPNLATNSDPPMVEIKIDYEGELHCNATHQPSGKQLVTDAPLDNNGRGEAFSPTDLVATAVGTCMATLVGIVARRKDLALAGMTVTVRKFMSEDLPRRISRLEVDLNLPLPASHPERQVIERAALSCPVYHSIHPDIEVVTSWQWQ